MDNKGFGSDLWRNVQAVRLNRAGGLEVPVRAGKNGIVIGVDAIARSEVANHEQAAAPASSIRWWKRLSRR